MQMPSSPQMKWPLAASKQCFFFFFKVEMGFALSDSFSLLEYNHSTGRNFLIPPNPCPYLSKEDKQENLEIALRRVLGFQAACFPLLRNQPFPTESKWKSLLQSKDITRIHTACNTFPLP